MEDEWRRQWHPTPVLLPGESHGWRSLVGCSPWGREESDMAERLHFHFSLLCIGEWNGNPLRCSCLENPRDGVAQSRTWLKWLNSKGNSQVASLLAQLVKNLPANAGDPGSIPESGSSPGKGIGYPLQHSWASLVAQMVKNLPIMRETWVWSLGWEDPLEEGMATHFSMLPWRIPMDRGAWLATVHRVTKSWTKLSD